MAHRLLFTLCLIAALVGCGSTDDATLSVAERAAEINTVELAFSDQFATTEMLDVRTGEAVSLDQVVSGDRAVLLWYWAPD